LQNLQSLYLAGHWYSNSTSVSLNTTPPSFWLVYANRSQASGSGKKQGIPNRLN